MATPFVGYPPSQNHVDTPPLGPPGPAGETLQPPIDILHNLQPENVLRNEIEELCSATLTIDTAFKDIGEKLSQVTKEQKKRERYKTCYDLETRWKQHHKKIEEKSETSQDLSQKFVDFVRTLEAYIADFSRAVEGLGFREQPEKCGILKNEVVTAKADMHG
ncbi:hypothetical protein PAXINDRAFT_100325 [Paxillus involutus ATCC 200175]|uniref:Uncharacterized protein n=1 Tax=Paxillus involutus ATCC 200175 TaxID=664439 RepID=A0A0C9U3P1_PAXIN|nr:hypothetical protein PAXINDRAFT_100325 [Paxillus involutus ATCC 200175]